MNVREGQPSDIPCLVELDHQSYGKHGENTVYFETKLPSPNTKIVVMEQNGKIAGFVVIEALGKNQIPTGFADLEISAPLENNMLIWNMTRSAFGKKMVINKLERLIGLLIQEKN